MKYSIVIPTYNHCEKYLKPCIESIRQNTDLLDVEIIVSANGCADNTLAYLESNQDIKYVWSDNPLGYPKATNAGIRVANGDKIILLNNDTVLLDQTKNHWIELLSAPFKDKDCGISCVIKNHSDAVNREFAVFFCVMIDRNVFDAIGLLNEEFGVGSGEDIDFCIRAEEAGFKVIESAQKIWNGQNFTGSFPIYHVGEGTVKDENLVSNWDSIYEHNLLKLAKKYNQEWYRWKLTNNYERAVFLKGDYVFPRESARYVWANENLVGNSIMEVGCSTGYGIQFLDSINTYVGIDYDPFIIEVAKEQDWGDNVIFLNKDINLLNEFSQYDTIIAFEVIEHLDNGLEIVEKLKKSCKNLLISVPHNEPIGFWGEHHKLHGLNESYFQGFKFDYIDEHGNISSHPASINESNRCNLMLCRWTHE